MNLIKQLWNKMRCFFEGHPDWRSGDMIHHREPETGIEHDEYQYFCSRCGSKFVHRVYGEK